MTDSRSRSGPRRSVAVLAAAALTLVIGPTTASTSAQAAATPHAIRLIASASSVVDAQGAVWSPDARFADGGTTWVSSAAIASTTDDKVFQPERWGVRGYDIPVPASGSYRVTLNAAEVVYRDAGRRVFSVLAEGTRVVQDLDLVRAAGFAGAHSVTFTTTVTDGELNLDLVASIENTKVSSLKVEAVSGTPAVARVVAGGSSVTDASGAVWASDRMYAEGGTTWTSTQAIAGTTNDRIFQAERWGVRGYSIPVPAAGTYAVTLNAAEVAFTLTGQRVFSIVAEGQTKISNLDLVRTVGAAAAHSSRFDVTVADGVLNLSLPASVNSSKVSSIAVDSGSSTTAIVTPAPTPTPTPTPTPAPSPSPATPFGAPMTADPTAPRGGGFTAASVWQTSIRTAPLAANSAALVNNLTNQVNSLYGGNAAFNVWQYSGIFYSVPASQPRVDIKWNDCQGKGSVPTGLLGPGGQFTSVPLPSNAAGSNGTDASLSLYQPSTDTLWDFWKLSKRTDGWYACWGGRIDKVSTNRGWFLNGFGASATALAGEGGMVNIRDVQAGSIDHALSLAVLRAARTYSWPAQRSDGSDTAADAIPEGTRFKLDPAVNVDAMSMHPIAKMIAKAAQTYGFIVTDRAGTVGVAAEAGTAVEVFSGTNPWHTLMAGTPSYGIMAGFPWNRLQALPKDYGKS